MKMLPTPTSPDALKTVVVAVGMDQQSRELLTWALVKVAVPGDTVLALHVVATSPSATDLFTLMKDFESIRSPENMVGRGGSSRVYKDKGCLPDGKEVAVKTLKPTDDALGTTYLETESLVLKGLPNAGSLISASFTSDGRHIVSAGEDSRVHIWSHHSQGSPHLDMQRASSLVSASYVALFQLQYLGTGWILEILFQTHLRFPSPMPTKNARQTCPVIDPPVVLFLLMTSFQSSCPRVRQYGQKSSFHRARRPRPPCEDPITCS